MNTFCCNSFRTYYMYKIGRDRNIVQPSWKSKLTLGYFPKRSMAIDILRNTKARGSDFTKRIVIVMFISKSQLHSQHHYIVTYKFT